MTKAAPLAIISSLPVILGCALLGATEASAVPYEVTIAPGAGSTVVATSNEGGAIDTTGLFNTFNSMPTANEPAILFPSTGRLETGMGPVSVFSAAASGTGAMFTGPRTFGTAGSTPPVTSTAVGPSAGIALINTGAFIPNDQVNVPLNHPNDTAIDVSTAIFPGTFASLGLTPGIFRWTWDGGGPGTNFPDRSFTIDVVPGPIVGAGLPGLIAALGGLVAMARRRRKQLA